MPTTYTYPIQLTQQFRFCGNPFRLDMYRGCDYGCLYCFANLRTGKRKVVNVDEADINYIADLFHKAFDTGKPSANILVEMMRKKVPMHVGGMSVPFQTREWKCRLTYKVIELSNQYHYPLIFSSKVAGLPVDYWRVLNPKIHAFQTSLMGVSPDFIRKYETHTPLPADRIRFIFKLRDAGFWSAVRIQPLIDLDQASQLVIALKDRASYITVEHLKAPASGEMLAQLFPDLDQSKYYRPSSVRSLELRIKYKMDNITALKALTSTPIGAGDNDLHFMTDGRNCCGCDLMNENFSNWLKYNYTTMTTGDGELPADTWLPEGNVRSFIGNESRVPGKSKFKDYVDIYCRDMGMKLARPGKDQMPLF